MRTSQILKFFGYGILFAGVFYALKFFSPTSVEFWVAVLLSILFWLILRVIAITADLIYAIRNDFARVLTNIERGLYFSNSLSKEIRDLVELEKGEKETHENTSH